MLRGLTPAQRRPAAPCRRLWNGTAWEEVPGEQWRPSYTPDDPIICMDALVIWRVGASGTTRHSFRLSADAPPGWYRWCTDVMPGGERTCRWLCSTVFRVAVPAGV